MENVDGNGGGAFVDGGGASVNGDGEEVCVGARVGAGVYAKREGGSGRGFREWNWSWRRPIHW